MNLWAATLFSAVAGRGSGQSTDVLPANVITLKVSPSRIASIACATTALLFSIGKPRIEPVPEPGHRLQKGVGDVQLLNFQVGEGHKLRRDQARLHDGRPGARGPAAPSADELVLRCIEAADLTSLNGPRGIQPCVIVVKGTTAGVPGQHSASRVTIAPPPTAVVDVALLAFLPTVPAGAVDAMSMAVVWREVEQGTRKRQGTKLPKDQYP